MIVLSNTNLNVFLDGIRNQNHTKKHFSTSTNTDQENNRSLILRNTNLINKAQGTP